MSLLNKFFMYVYIILYTPLDLSGSFFHKFFLLGKKVFTSLSGSTTKIKINILFVQDETTTNQLVLNPG